MVLKRAKNGRSEVTASRREREKAQRREVILQAAREVFFERGIHHATVDEVAEQAEVSKGTVYLYFNTKETILAHLLLEGLERLVGDLETAFAPAESISAPDRIRRLATAYLKFYQTYPAHFQLMSAFDRGRFQEAIAPDLYSQVLTRSLRGLEWLVRAVEQGRAENTLRAGDTRQGASLLWAGLNGVLVLLNHPLRREIVASDLESLYVAMTETLLKGMSVER
ncbi:MAG TPA: TetR/AcrR family transcriptional regulator [Anaerolineae bacterium]|nr:TetR/AcrR family transcriptional regulator [Anaerolineae bacterium]